jgi:hypothetical protein
MAPSPVPSVYVPKGVTVTAPVTANEEGCDQMDRSPPAAFFGRYHAVKVPDANDPVYEVAAYDVKRINGFTLFVKSLIQSS